jgi:hypothetical protein
MSYPGAKLLVTGADGPIDSQLTEALFRRKPTSPLWPSPSPSVATAGWTICRTRPDGTSKSSLDRLH